MKKITFLLFVVITSLGYAQSFPLDFSDPLDVFSGNNGSSSQIINNPMGCAADGCMGEVLEINGAAGQFDDPIILALDTFVDLSDSANNTVTLDFYASRDGNLLVQFGAAQQNDPGENGFPVEINVPVTTGLNSLVLDYDTAANGFPNQGDPVTLDSYAQIALFVDFAEAGVVATHWVDNIAGGLDGGSTSVNDATLSDLQVDGTTIAGFDPGNTSYVFQVPAGTMTIPQITSATTTSSGATTNITQATAIPGNATVDVTSQDGTVMQTYTVSISESGANIVDSDASAPFTGFINANPDCQGGFGFQQPDVSQLVTVLDVMANTITLKPQLTLYDANPGDCVWDNGMGDGGSIVEANTFVEDNSLSDNDLTFQGNVSSFTIDTGRYNVVAFIKGLDPNAGFADVVGVSTPLTSTGNFSITATAAQLSSTTTPGIIVQYGFAVTGRNAPSAQEAALGNVVVTQFVLSNEDFELNNFKVYPNPSVDVWNIEANTSIESIEIFDLLGKNVTSLSPNSQRVAIDASSLKTGIYLARITGNGATKTLKLVRD